MAGIYIHIPFCASKCIYCDFYSSTELGLRGQLYDAVVKELRAQRSYLAGQPVRTIYFGGGTPSLLMPGQLQGLVDEIKGLWDFGGLSEVTVEANPDDLNPEYLHELAATDINRLSIGIQSFIDRDLGFMGRRHTAGQAVDAVRSAQLAGFDNITIDLIYGIPGMSADEWRSNVEQAAGLGVQHISAYHLTVEPGTPLGCLAGNGGFRPIDEQSSEEHFAVLREVLSATGYEHYEISNFALPGLRAVHNSSYWTGERYLGVGPSAHSYNGSSRRSVIASLREYIAGVGTDIIYSTEILSETDLYNEYLMTSLRRVEGVDTSELARRFGQGRLAAFERTAAAFLDAGVMEAGRDANELLHYRIPASKFLVSDSIISAFFEVA